MLRKRFFWIIMSVLLLATAGGGYYHYNVYLPAQAPVENSTSTTVQVSQGDLVTTALGSGILVPVSEVAIVFHSGAPPSPGHLAASLGR